MSPGGKFDDTPGGLSEPLPPHHHGWGDGEACVEEHTDTEPLPSQGPRTDAGHTHDLRIGAREYESGIVRAWQVYCAICDEAGRILVEREAASPALDVPCRHCGNPDHIKEYARLTAAVVLSGEQRP